MSSKRSNPMHSQSATAIGEAVAKATAESIALDADSSMSIKDLKKGLRVALADSGVLSNIKSQLRREFIANMKQKAAGAPSTYEQAGLKMDLATRISFSAVHHMLKRRGLQHSLAVFAAESGLEASKSSLLSEMDIVRAMNIPTESPVYAVIASTTSSVLTDKENRDSEARHASSLSSSSSLGMVGNNILDLLMENVFRKYSGKKDTRDSSIQTEVTVNNPRQELDNALYELQAKYVQQTKINRENPSRDIEERMLAYQKDCDERCRRDVELQMGVFRNHEQHRIRLDEAAKARLALQSLKNDLENDYARKTRAQETRDTEIIRQNAETDRKHQQQLYETRQKMQREVDEMRTREMSTGRRFEIEQQGLTMLELQLKDIQNKIEAREREVLIREKEVDRRALDLIKAAKEEARDSLRSELEESLRDRKHLSLERQRFEDEKNKHSASLDSLKNLRVSLMELQDNLSKKEAEMDKMSLALKKAEGIIRGDYTDSSSTQQNQLLLTMRRNVELEGQIPVLLAENAKYREAQSAREHSEGVVEAQAREISRLQVLYNTSITKNTADMDSIENLKEKLESERVKVIALTLKSKELERLLGDKRKVIASLAGGRNLPIGGAGAGAGAGAGSTYNYASLNSSGSSTHGDYTNRDGRERSYRDVQQQFAYKRAEEFANAIIQQKRATNSAHAEVSTGGSWAAGGVATKAAVAAVVNSTYTYNNPNPTPVSPSKYQQHDINASGSGNPHSPSKIPRYVPVPTPVTNVAVTSSSTTAPTIAAADMLRVQREKDRADYEEQMEAEAAAWEAEKAHRKSVLYHQREVPVKESSAAEQASAQVRQAEEHVTQALALALAQNQQKHEAETLAMSMKKKELTEASLLLEKEKKILFDQRVQQQQYEKEQIDSNTAMLTQQENQLKAMQAAMLEVKRVSVEEECKHTARLNELKREQEAFDEKAKQQQQQTATAAVHVSTSTHRVVTHRHGQSVGQGQGGGASSSSSSSSSSFPSSPPDMNTVPVTSAGAGSPINISNISSNFDQSSVTNLTNDQVDANTGTGTGSSSNSNGMDRSNNNTDDSAVTKLATHQSQYHSNLDTSLSASTTNSNDVNDGENEESRKEAEDAARIHEARMKVLARRKGKQDREQGQGQGSSTVGVFAGGASRSSSQSSEKAAPKTKASEVQSFNANFSKADSIGIGSDVEITIGNAGDSSGADNSDGDSSWF